ncbi:MAG: hypothetical protein IPG18_17750 [Saprospiraceae bacterium]|nr:hypothetical protein [Saprospiraceae bacterium]
MRNVIQFLSVLLFVFIANQMVAQKIQYSRANNQSGMHVFEPSKVDDVGYDGFKLQIGGAFTQGFQSLNHENSDTITVPANKLYAMSGGFNLAAANLNFDIQLGDGIRIFLENYMASRHHNEFWVKGGYIQIDKLPMFNNPEWFTKYVRVKIGHMEVNYGDQHFRRSDGGNTIFNAFAENNIMDQFATEIGGEVYLFPVKGLTAMLGLTGGLINNNIFDYSTNPATAVQKRNPAILLKLAYDNMAGDLRYRLSASMYTNSETPRSTLFAGDRTGSNYFGALESTAFNATSNFTSGRFNPYSSLQKVTAIMINPFVKWKGLEVFGTYELVNGKAKAETDDRKTTQIAVEGVYRFLANEQLFVAARYNQVTARLAGYTDDVSVDRIAVAAGWFPTKNLLLKGEYVIQNYNDFKGNDIRNEGKFDGIVVQAVVGF